MSQRAVQALIGHAIVDRDFRHRLMNGYREQVIAQFDLSEDEREVIRSIQAQTFEEFAWQLHGWIMRLSRQTETSAHSATHAYGPAMFL